VRIDGCTNRGKEDIEGKRLDNVEFDDNLTLL
jgi:hypothetical protein